MKSSRKPFHLHITLPTGSTDRYHETNLKAFEAGRDEVIDIVATENTKMTSPPTPDEVQPCSTLTIESELYTPQEERDGLECFPCLTGSGKWAGFGNASGGEFSGVQSHVQGWVFSKQAGQIDLDGLPSLGFGGHQAKGCEYGFPALDEVNTICKDDRDFVHDPKAEVVRVRYGSTGDNGYVDHAKQASDGRPQGVLAVDEVEPPVVASKSISDVGTQAFTQAECKLVKPQSVTKSLRARLLATLAEYFHPNTNTIENSFKAPRAELKIVGLLASTADQGSHLYADMTRKNCAALTKDLRGMLGDQLGADVAGLLYEKRIVEGSFEAVKSEIERIGRDGTMDGLIVYFSLFGVEQDTILRSLIPQHLDLEGLHPDNLSAAYLRAPPSTFNETGKADFQVEIEQVYPCTPLAIMRFLEHVLLGEEGGEAAQGRQWLRGKVCTVINRSEVVGRPLASFLASCGALVHSMDHESSHVYRPTSTVSNASTSHLSASGLYEINTNGPDMVDALGKSDIVISGVPVASFKVPTAAIKDGAVCLDFSTGDGNFETDVQSKASTFIPKIGPATILMLQQNALTLRKRKQSNAL